MQLIGRQPQIGETIIDQTKHISINHNETSVKISPVLTNQYGTLSKAICVAIIEETIKHELRKYKSRCYD